MITPEVKQQLREALQAHAASAPAAVVPNYLYDSNLLSRGDDGVAPVLPEPPEVKALRREGAMYHKQYAVLKERLRALFDTPQMSTDEDRYNIAREIMQDVIPATDAVYERIRTWEKTGVLPLSGSQQVVRETVAKYDKLLSLRSRVSRITGWLDKGQRKTKKGWESLTSILRNELEEELADKKKQIEYIEIELGDE